jgi:hypothetical protein
MCTLLSAVEHPLVTLEVCYDKLLLLSSSAKYEGLPAYFHLHLPSRFLKIVGVVTILLVWIDILQGMLIAEDCDTITSKSCLVCGLYEGQEKGLFAHICERHWQNASLTE